MEITEQDKTTLVRWMRSNLKKAALCAGVLSDVTYKKFFYLSNELDRIRNELENMITDLNRLFGTEGTMNERTH